MYARSFCIADNNNNICLHCHSTRVNAEYERGALTGFGIFLTTPDLIRSSVYLRFILGSINMAPICKWRHLCSGTTPACHFSLSDNVQHLRIFHIQLILEWKSASPLMVDWKISNPFFMDFSLVIGSFQGRRKHLKLWGGGGAAL